MAPPPSAAALRVRRKKPVGTTRRVAKRGRIGGLPLLDLPEGVLLHVLRSLGPKDLAAFETSCKEARRKCRTLNLWRELGAHIFHGQLQSGESFLVGKCGETTAKRVSVDWKSRYKLFNAFSKTFRETDRPTMTFVDDRDHVAYLSARIEVDCLRSCGGNGIYLEVLVQKNADNLSLACVDFDSGGKSSVTFSPDTGAVIKESKIQENPRKVRGSYRQPLAQIQQLQPKSSLVLTRFEGLMGMLLNREGLTFYRRLPGSPWECTGVVTDLSWVQGEHVTPCIAFRDNGIYHVVIRRLGVYCPPRAPKRSSLEPPVMSEDGWQPLDWESTDGWEYLSDASDDDEGVGGHILQEHHLN